MDTHIIAETKKAIQEKGAEALTVNDLTFEDLHDVSWSGGPLHIKAIKHALDRVAKGQVEYLAVRSPSGKPIAIGGIDYTPHKGAGKLWQLVTHDQLRSLGIGSRLISEAEERIKRRGLEWAELCVEEKNPQAQNLYLKLGYEVYGDGQESWEELDREGKPYTYHTTVKVMKKKLASC